MKGYMISYTSHVQKHDVRAHSVEKATYDSTLKDMTWTPSNANIVNTKTPIFEM